MGSEQKLNLPLVEMVEDRAGDAGREPIDAESHPILAHSSTLLIDEHDRHPTELRAFLVACYQASVSIETMSNNLGLDADTIRSELLRGIEAWNAAQI